MALIEWKEDYALGIPDVDEEHRELIALINTLYDELYAPSEPESAADFLGEVYARSSAHFALEERVMREHGYDEYQDHKADHERLLDDIRCLMDEFELGEVSDLDAFGVRLDNWFSTHFASRDARLHHMLG